MNRENGIEIEEFYADDYYFNIYFYRKRILKKGKVDMIILVKDISQPIHIKEKPWS